MLDNMEILFYFYSLQSQFKMFFLSLKRQRGSCIFDSILKFFFFLLGIDTYPDRYALDADPDQGLDLAK